MSFNSLAFKFFSVASNLMGISAPLQNQGAWLSVDGSDILTGDESFIGTLWIIIRNSIGDLAIVLYETIVRLFYAIGRWVLTFIDFIFVFIRQMVGMNSDFDSVEEITKGDLIFQFVFDESVIRIIRNVLIFSIVLLIIFAIFAIIKSEYEFVTQGGGNSKSKIIAGTLKSLFLMILVPLVAIGSIVMSNAILRSLYLISSGGNTTMSMGTQIFVSSTYEANAYRRYANRNLKIPITFNFSEITDNDNISGYYTDGTVAEMESALKAFKEQDVWTRGYKTFLMFASNGFLNMRDLDELDKKYAEHNEISDYHLAYDDGIYSRTEQYYIMADVVEYALRTNTVLYFKTLEEVYKSYYEADRHVEGEKPLGIEKTDKGYSISVHYEGDKAPTVYTHKAGETDEAKGAVYIIAMEKRVDSENENVTNEPYYYPLKNGLNNFSTSRYEGTQNFVIAKGLFEDGKYPTAIRKDGGDVQFYRDDINIPMLADLFPKISYEMPEGAFEGLGVKILKGSLTMLTGVDISQFIPYVYFSIDIFHLFTKTTNNIADLKNGCFNIDYNFSSTDFDKANVYKLSDFNIVIFAFASILLVSILIKLLAGLVFRVLDITTLAIAYPAVLATIPLDDGGRFSGWVQQFASKLLSVYAVVVGVNLVLILAPLSWNIELFTASDIEYAIGFGELGATITADFLNAFMHFFFLLVAFASIQPFINAIGQYVNQSSSGKEYDVSNPILKDGEMVLNDLKSGAGTVGKFISGAIFIEKGHEILSTATAFALPGSQAVSEGVSTVMGGINDVKKMKEKAGKVAGTLANIKTTSGDAKSSKEKNEVKHKNSDGNAKPEKESSAGNEKQDKESSAGNGNTSENSNSVENSNTIKDINSSMDSGLTENAKPEQESPIGNGNASENSSSAENANTADDKNSAVDSSSTENAKPEQESQAENNNASQSQEVPDMDNQSEESQAENESFAGEGDEKYESRTGGRAKRSAGAKVAGFTGRASSKLVRTTATLAKGLLLAGGVLVVGLTKTALKMAGRVIKSTAITLDKMAIERELRENDPNQNIDFAGAFFGLTGAGIKGVATGVSGITKTGYNAGKSIAKSGTSAGKDIIAKDKGRKDSRGVENNLESNASGSNSTLETNNNQESQSVNEQSETQGGVRNPKPESGNKQFEPESKAKNSNQELTGLVGQNLSGLGVSGVVDVPVQDNPENYKIVGAEKTDSGAKINVRHLKGKSENSQNSEKDDDASDNNQKPDTNNSDSEE